MLNKEPSRVSGQTAFIFLIFRMILVNGDGHKWRLDNTDLLRLGKITDRIFKASHLLATEKTAVSNDTSVTEFSKENPRGLCLLRVVDETERRGRDWRGDAAIEWKVVEMRL